MNSPLKKILVIDDEEIIRLSVARILQQQGYECVSVEGATTAQDVLREESVDLIISDVRMEGNIELEFFKELQDHYSHIPLIIMTGFPSIPPKLREIPLSMIYCLTKPFDSEELERIVSEVLSA